jgi:CBS domain-containing protein
MKAGDCNLIKHFEISYGSSVKKAAELFKKTKARQIFVTKKKVPLGIISTVDIVNEIVAKGKSPVSVKVEKIMKAPIYACDHDEPIASCYFKLAKHNIAVIPVIKDNSIAGLLTSQEIMNYFVKKGAEK